MGVTPLTLTSWVLPTSQAAKRSLSVFHRPGGRQVPWEQRSGWQGRGAEEEAVVMGPCLGTGPGPCSPTPGGGTEPRGLVLRARECCWEGQYVHTHHQEAVQGRAGLFVTQH